MKGLGLLDSSVLIAALVTDEGRHAECLALLKQGGHSVYAHSLLETFSTLTGGRLGLRVDADLAVKLFRETVYPQVQIVELKSEELLSALKEARAHGVRGGAVYDFMHLVAARKAGVATLFTLNLTDFEPLRSSQDPVIRLP
jgi:predicted nucleic acid-binding protein